MKRQKTIELNPSATKSIMDSALSTSVVNGLTHNFYRYPARFSPNFVRQIIQHFTKPSDLVVDPFVGGGTTLVEARALGRCAIGIDINSLATFVTKAKTTPLINNDVREIKNWLQTINRKLNLHNRIYTDEEWVNYYRNIDCRKTWPIRKTIHLGIENILELSSNKQQQFTRCALLKTAQWALDSRKEIPSASEFRTKFIDDIEAMLYSILDYSTKVRNADKNWSLGGLHRLKVLNRSTIGIHDDDQITSYPKPRLILTSPPYPGVHVLYHRWQVNGRRETPAPYWIANELDGSGASYYTFGDRKNADLSSYYSNSLDAFSSLAKICNRNTITVQMVAFSDRSWQLPLYLEMMEQAGFAEQKVRDLGTSRDGRLWRVVPNRKWYADYKGRTSSSKEVVLFFKRA